MLKQEILGFETEKDFIAAVQMALRKEQSQRGQSDRDILRAFVDDYNDVVQHIAKQGEFDNEHAREELPQEIWTEICAKIKEWKFQGYKFTAWLSSVAHSAVVNWRRKQGIIRIPHPVYNNRVKPYKQAQETLWNRLERNPMDEELASELNWCVKRVRETTLIIERIAMISLDVPIVTDENNEAITMRDLVPTPPPYLEVEDKLAIEECFDRLPDVYRAILILRLWENHTERETASMLGIPKGTVASYCSRALNKLRKCLENIGYRKR